MDVPIVAPVRFASVPTIPHTGRLQQFLVVQDQLLDGTVVSVEQDTVLIQIGRQQVSAHVDVPVHPGEDLQFMVREVGPERILLQIMGQGTARQTPVRTMTSNDLSNTLQEIGLSANAESMDIAQELLKNGLAVTSANILDVRAGLARDGTVTAAGIRAAVFLKANDVPLAHDALQVARQALATDAPLGLRVELLREALSNLATQLREAADATNARPLTPIPTGLTESSDGPDGSLTLSSRNVGTGTSLETADGAAPVATASRMPAAAIPAQVSQPAVNRENALPSSAGSTQNLDFMNAALVDAVAPESVPVAPASTPVPNRFQAPAIVNPATGTGVDTPANPSAAATNIASGSVANAVPTRVPVTNIQGPQANASNASIPVRVELTQGLSNSDTGRGTLPAATSNQPADLETVDGAAPDPDDSNAQLTIGLLRGLRGSLARLQDDSATPAAASPETGEPPGTRLPVSTMPPTVGDAAASDDQPSVRRLSNLVNDVLRQMPILDERSLAAGSKQLAEQIQQVVAQNGTPIEAKLARILNEAGVNGTVEQAMSDDLKSLVGGLLDEAQRQLESHEINRHLDESVVRELRAVTTSAQSVMGDVELEQMTNAASNAKGNDGYLMFQLPIPGGHDGQTAQLRIHQDAQGNAKRIDPDNTSMVFQFDLQNLGTVRVLLRVHDHRVSCTMGSTDPVATELLSTNSAELKDSLSDIGYFVDDLKCSVISLEDLRAEPAAPAPPPELHRAMHVDARI